MKMVFVVHSEYYAPQVMRILRDAAIDYYTRWDRAIGKGAGTEPHLGAGSYGSTNSVLMIAFESEGPLELLIKGVDAANAEIKRPDDRIRIFQVPLERIV